MKNQQPIKDHLRRLHMNFNGLFSIALFIATLIPYGVQAQVSLEAARDGASNGKVLVIDIREPHEHATGVAKGMKLIPMSTLGQRLGEVPKDANKPVLLICNTQNRSSAVVRELQSRGYTNVQYVNSGMSEWVRRGWATQKP
jgi:rhodanese-related sulfurtransferase